MIEPGLGGGRQQALQVQKRRGIIDGESTDITNPRREVRHHKRFAIGARGKAALAWADPAEVAVRAHFGNFREFFGGLLHSASVLSGGGKHQIGVG